MVKKLTLISVVFLVFGIVLGSPLVAKDAVDHEQKEGLSS